MCQIMRRSGYESVKGSPTVRISNYCSKCVDRPGILHDRKPSRHTVPWTCIQPHALDSTARDNFFITQLGGS